LKSNDSFDKVECCFDIVAGVDGAERYITSTLDDAHNSAVQNVNNLPFVSVNSTLRLALMGPVGSIV